jgi:protein-S-isoprenylcysteine O-methyltransferase Ste14
MNARLAAGASFFAITIPGTVVIGVPYCILRRLDQLAAPQASPVTVLAALIGLASVGALFHSIWGFASHGKGTLAPVHAPKVLVVRGLYRYTRNPMYLAVVCILLAEGILFRSCGVLTYAGICLVLFHLFVVFYEEPRLRTLFGSMYDEYCQAVPRWGITPDPYSPGSAPTAPGQVGDVWRRKITGE